MSLCQHCRIALSACCLAALLFFFALTLSPLAPIHRALALSSSSSISIASQSSTVNFPDSITFNVSVADASSNIISADIVIDLQNNNGAETHVVPFATAQHSLKLSYQDATTGDNFIPPGATITYFWRFADSVGTTYTQPEQSLTTSDTRFAWQHLNRGLLQVNWYGRSQEFGQIILSTASGDLDSIKANLGSGLVSPINLWVYASDTDFHGSLPPGSYEWVGGIAFPQLLEASIVVTDSNDYTLSRDMPHELTHLVFHQLIGLQNVVPTWFDEGLAVSNQQFHEQNMIDRFNQALSNHSLLRLDSISFGFPADSDQAYLAYAQSWNLVQYMYSTFGKAKMFLFIKDLGSPSYDFDHAMQAALGIDSIHLENQWRLHLNQPGIPLPPGQVTPTPQTTSQPDKQPTGAASGSGDTSSWALILLGGTLVLVSLGGLIVLVVFLARSRRRETVVLPAAGTRDAQHNHNGIPTFDPSIYAQNSMYMRPADSAPPWKASPSQPTEAQPVQSSPQAWSPPGTSQGYAHYRPVPPYPQAPQE